MSRDVDHVLVVLAMARDRLFNGQDPFTGLGEDDRAWLAEMLTAGCDTVLVIVAETARPMTSAALRDRLARGLAEVQP